MGLGHRSRGFALDANYCACPFVNPLKGVPIGEFRILLFVNGGDRFSRCFAQPVDKVSVVQPRLLKGMQFLHVFKIHWTRPGNRQVIRDHGVVNLVYLFVGLKKTL